MKRDIEIKPTPGELANAFWRLGSDEQAEFFHELHKVVSKDCETNPSLYSLGEMQWLYMTQGIRKHSAEAQEMYLAFCSFAYDFWPRKDNMVA